MAQNLSCRLIFLASPSGLAAERLVCRKVVADFHEMRSISKRATFFVHAWEDVPGGVGRPQDLINPNLDDCDYLLMLLGDSWGSPPADDGRYTSGTEEEFAHALDLLADATRPMRDILVLFKTLEPSQLRDPGDKLKPVMKFRAWLEESKSLLYHTFDSDESLVRALGRQLDQWSKPLTEKKASRIELPEGETDVVPDPRMRRPELLESARALAKEGLRMQAEAAFANATADGDAMATLEFARFMARTGNFERALELNNDVLTNTDLLTSEGPDALAARVNALANIGVIQRKQGNLPDSASSLYEAVITARKSRSPIYGELCYALDNYGFTLLRLERTEDALVYFQEAHELRGRFGTPKEGAQSAINLARSHISRSESEQAARLFDEALTILAQDPDDHLQANALCGAAEARLRLAHLDGVETFLSDALEINARIRNSDGLSITYSLMARLHLTTAEFDKALREIDSAAEESGKSGNETGLGVVSWLRSELCRLQGEMGVARSHLQAAKEHLALSGSPTLGADIAHTEALLDDIGGIAPRD